MKPRHIALAVLVAAIWGVNFVVVHFGLNHFPPLFLVAIRFIVSALPVLFVPRPAVGWPRMIMVAASLFITQFGLLFAAMAHGMPPGLASVILQSQAFFTILIAMVVLREVPSGRQLAGLAIALAGLAAIVATVGGDVTWIGLAMTLAAASAWAIGNIALRGVGKVDMLSLMVWLSLIPPIPLLGLSIWLEGGPAILDSLHRFDLGAVGILLYLAVASTLIGYGAWGHLLKLYPVGVVAPFSLLVPLFGAASSALLTGERFGPGREAGAALVVIGLGVMSLRLPWPWRRAWAPAVEGNNLSD